MCWPLYARNAPFSFREARRLFTLDPWLPCTKSSSEEERETHTTCELHINHSHIQHYHSIPSHLLLRFIDILQQISTHSNPSSSTLPHEQSPASTRSLHRRQTATFACLDTEPYTLSNTYTSSQWPPPPPPQQHKAPSPPLPPMAMSSNGTPPPPQKKRDQTRPTQLTFSASNPNSWPS